MLILATKCVVKLIEFQCEGIALLSLLICFYAAVNFHLLLNVFNRTFKAEIENISSGFETCPYYPDIQICWQIVRVQLSNCSCSSKNILLTLKDLSSKFIYWIYIRRQRPCIYVSVLYKTDSYTFQPIELFLSCYVIFNLCNSSYSYYLYL